MTADYVVVLPTVEVSQARGCLASMPDRVRERTWVVWNTRHRESSWPFSAVGGYWSPPRNIGVAASWNLGISKAEQVDAAYLVLCSTGVTFGPDGGAWFDHLDAKHPPHALQSQLGWRLIAIARDTWHTVGAFDENFWPAYMEDTDYLYRMGLAGLPSPRENGQPLPFRMVDVAHVAESHALRTGAVQVDFGLLRWHYEQKWGGQQGNERFTHPFNQDGRDWRWCPTGSELAAALMRQRDTEQEGDCNAP